MRKLWKSVKELIMTPLGIISIILQFLLISGTPLITIGHILNSPYIYGLGYTIFLFYLAPNGIAIFGFVVLAPLLYKLLRLIFSVDNFTNKVYYIDKLDKYKKELENERIKTF